MKLFFQNVLFLFTYAIFFSLKRPTLEIKTNDYKITIIETLSIVTTRCNDMQY